MYRETRVPLLCTYDEEADAAYIYLSHPLAPGSVQRTATVDATDVTVNVDFNAEGHAVGIEILGAGTRLPPSLRQAITRS
ncbi:DUF2283 domain-containing protein [Actinoplanes sp. NPDC024001]|uniref:DUF2283 domain-containing protein n=1 Tax=Actinoplanes sp. NPDC024001 TaxID=3154598 RepID=UPI0033F98A6F